MVIEATMLREKYFMKQFRASSWVRIAIGVFLIVNSLSMILAYRSKIREVAHGMHRTDRTLLEAYTWLDTHSNPRDIVLPSAVYPIGNQIPRYTHCSVYCGYHFVTVEFKKKEKIVERFFLSQTPDSFREKLLDENAVRYVFVWLKGCGPDTFDCSEADYLNEVYRNDAAVIYAVLPQ
ncbi:MAG: hypothetical protein GF384_01065 [Elusimicrobia bacterium]|nr:hypothetical protein [Elusimicrobiota bacterium]